MSRVLSLQFVALDRERCGGIAGKFLSGVLRHPPLPHSTPPLPPQPPQFLPRLSLKSIPETVLIMEGKTWKVGIVGCGMVTQSIHLPTLLRLYEKFLVVGLCDVSPGALSHCAKKFGIAQTYASSEALCAVKEIDIIVVANSDEFHAIVAIQAINAGKHVLLEKPMALNHEDCEKIIAARDAKGVKVLVGLMRRYSPAVQTMVDEVASMGRVNFARVRAIIGQNGQFLSQSTTDPRAFGVPAEFVEDSKEKQNAQLSKAVEKKELFPIYRLLMGLSTHDTCILRKVLGMPKDVIGAKAWTANGQAWITAMLDYGDYACMFETGLNQVMRFDAHIHIYGDKKDVMIQYDTPFIPLPITVTVREQLDDGIYVERVIRNTYEDCYTREWNHFYDNLVNNTPIETTPEDAHQDLFIYDKILRALSSS